MNIRPAWLRMAKMSCALSALMAASGVAQAASVIVINQNAAGVGFNDPTVAAPVGGNPGTTVGQQRLIAFQAAADVWGAHLSSSVPIRVGAQFMPLSCTANQGTLGSAGPVGAFRDFAGASVASTFYASALANSLARADLDPGSNDINANFNSNLGTTGCLQNGGWYYGLDGAPPANLFDFMTVLIHELGHGVGFLSLANLSTGAKFNGFNDAYMQFLENHGASPAAYPSMTDAQRAAANISTGNLHFVGPSTRAVSAILSAGKVGDHVRMFAPNPAQAGSSVSHFDTVATPNQIMEPNYTQPLHSPTLERALLRDTGWALQKPRSDFTGDAKTDILWRNSTGDTVVSVVNGASISSSTFIANLPGNWVVGGTGDFNGDGITDILWRNNATGDTVVSLMKGPTLTPSITSSTFIANLPTNWTVVGTGDFNGDGVADILWRNDATGDTVISFMNNGAIVSSVFIANLPTNWIVAGVGDFNGDGTADILWRNNSTGDTVVSTLVGGAIASSTFIANLPTSWSVAGTGDFNGDGKRDILWRNSNGDTIVSLMNGPSITSSTFIANVPPDWVVGQVGDVNGDGKADIFWRNNTNGSVVISLVDTTSITSSTAVANLANTWSMQGGNKD